MIKAFGEVVQSGNTQSFLVRQFEQSVFECPYHFHPEYELTFITKGTGKRYVGNHMEDFSAGDLILLGPNLPHCWKLGEAAGPDTGAGAIVIQFDGNFTGDDFLNKPEFDEVKKLFERSASGIRFNGCTQAIVNKKLDTMISEGSNFYRLLALLDVLQQLALSTEYTLLDQNRHIERSAAGQERINPVFAYLVDNFRGQVSLDEAAGIAHMTPNAFCKYFKKITGKTFIETIIDYRLNYATQQLLKTDKPISEISFESGFGDVSHFYKMFKNRMNMSPLNYRKKFMKNMGEQLMM